MTHTENSQPAATDQVTWELYNRFHNYYVATQMLASYRKASPHLSWRMVEGTEDQPYQIEFCQ